MSQVHETSPSVLWQWFLIPAIVMVVATGLVFLFPADMILSAPTTDLINQFVAWRAFAVESIQAGHWPLWNPYTYAGEPFLGGFQSGLLYPPNVIFLGLPLVRAINLSIVLLSLIHISRTTIISTIFT